jgi:cyclopropane fatty-acyl-phospholipid synthase-like methyltransferase
MEWKKHWGVFPALTAKTDFLRQVGKTVSGKPISAEQFNQILLQLITGLKLKYSDTVLDLCCGNGLITSKIAELCREVVGVDYSEPLIDIAKKYHKLSNVRYFLGSVLELPQEMINVFPIFTKVYMYEALQHFEDRQFSALLHVIKTVATDNSIVYFGSVPERKRIWSFYNTPARREDYHRRMAESGRDAIGTWWDREMIEAEASTEGFSVSFIEQHPSLHTAHYRFDVRLTRKNTGIV